MMDAAQLQAQREAMRSETAAPTASNTQKQKVLKWFNEAEKIATIKADPKSVTIGSGAEARSVVIRPLNPKQFVQAFVLIKEVLVPLITLYRPGEAAPGIPQILDALGSKVDKIPELIALILKRGNDISTEWIDEHLDLVLDLQLILPPFLEQNGLWKLFAGNDEQPAVSVVPLAESTTPQTTDQLTAV